MGKASRLKKSRERLKLTLYNGVREIETCFITCGVPEHLLHHATVVASIAWISNDLAEKKVVIRRADGIDTTCTVRHSPFTEEERKWAYDELYASYVDC